MNITFTFSCFDSIYAEHPSSPLTWGVDNRKGHNYQNHDFELTQLLYVIRHED